MSSEDSSEGESETKIGTETPVRLIGMAATSDGNVGISGALRPSFSLTRRRDVRFRSNSRFTGYRARGRARGLTRIDSTTRE